MMQPAALLLLKLLCSSRSLGLETVPALFLGWLDHDLAGFCKRFSCHERTCQLIDKNSEQGNISDYGTLCTAKSGCLIAHTDGDTSLRKESDAQILSDILITSHGSTGDPGSQVFTERTGQDEHDADQDILHMREYSHSIMQTRRDEKEIVALPTGISR